MDLFIIVFGILIVFFFYTLQLIAFKNFLQINNRLQELINEKRKKTDEFEQNPLILPFKERIIEPIVKKTGKIIMKLAPYSLKNKEQELLIQAGYPHNLTIQNWLIIRMVFWLASVLFASVIGFSQTGLLNKAGILFIGLVTGYILPILYLKKNGENRKQEIKRNLPYVLDILSVSVEAGLGFDLAIIKVIEKTNGTLSNEFSKTLQEIKMGKKRSDALKDLASRTNVDDLNQFITAIIQAEKLGIQISNILRIQAEDMRQKRKQRAEEKAMKAPIKILFPLILFIFPAVFIIILGPAAINIINIFMK